MWWIPSILLPDTTRWPIFRARIPNPCIPVRDGVLQQNFDVRPTLAGCSADLERTCLLYQARPIPCSGTIIEEPLPRFHALCMDERGGSPSAGTLPAGIQAPAARLGSTLPRSSPCHLVTAHQVQMSIAYPSTTMSEELGRPCPRRSLIGYEALGVHCDEGDDASWPRVCHLKRMTNRWTCQTRLYHSGSHRAKWDGGSKISRRRK